MSGNPWSAYKDTQRARRYIRRLDRWRELYRLLPLGVEQTVLTETSRRLSGYGYTVVYDPTHNTARVPGYATVTMTPEQLAAEFRWRWKRDGCPKSTTKAR